MRQWEKIAFCLAINRELQSLKIHHKDLATTSENKLNMKSVFLFLALAVVVNAKPHGIFIQDDPSTDDSSKAVIIVEELFQFLQKLLTSK